MGRKMVMVAGLLATSVMDVTIRQAIVTMTNTGRFPNGLISSATQVDKPDTCGLNKRMGKKKKKKGSVFVSIKTRKQAKNNCLDQEVLRLLPPNAFNYKNKIQLSTQYRLFCEHK